MNISKLYQRAHALRMRDKETSGEEAVAEFYVGWALGELIDDLKNANGEILLPRETQIHMVVQVLRRLAHKPEALYRTLVHFMGWPEEGMAALWEALLRTYGTKPRLLRAIADGMEA